MIQLLDSLDDGARVLRPHVEAGLPEPGSVHVTSRLITITVWGLPPLPVLLDWGSQLTNPTWHIAPYEGCGVVSATGSLDGLHARVQTTTYRAGLDVIAEPQTVDEGLVRRLAEKEAEDFVRRLAEVEEAYEPLPDTPLDPEPEPEDERETVTFYVTFTGLGLRVREHPTFPGAHPDGWLTVHAEDEGAALAAVYAELGHDWHQLMPDQPDAAAYPRGELGVLDTRSSVGITP